MEDLISRKKAIEAFEPDHHVDWYTPWIVKTLEELPSENPPIIHCKDCKWWDRNDNSSPYGYCHAMKHGYMSSNWEIGIYRRYKGDFFCADAELRGEEE